MHTTLWILAGVLAALFAGTGLAKLVVPREKLAATMAWTKDSTDQQVKLLGAAELAGAVGLVLPAALDIAPVLVPVAAICLALTMVGAVVVHVRHREGAVVAAPALILALCVLVAWGRLGPHPF